MSSVSQFYAAMDQYEAVTRLVETPVLEEAPPAFDGPSAPVPKADSTLNKMWSQLASMVNDPREAELKRLKTEVRLPWTAWTRVGRLLPQRRGSIRSDPSFFFLHSCPPRSPGGGSTLTEHSAG